MTATGRAGEGAGVTAVARARFRVAREAGHSVPCAQAFTNTEIDGDSPLARCVRVDRERAEMLAPVDPGTFGRVLRSRRLARGWSKSELARRCGVRYETILHWERDKRFPAPAYRTALRVALDLDRDADDGWWQEDYS